MLIVGVNITDAMFEHAHALCFYVCTADVGGFPLGQNSLRFFPSEKYRLVKLRLRKIPWGHFPFGFIAGGIFSGKISGDIHIIKQTQVMLFKSDK